MKAKKNSSSRKRKVKSANRSTAARRADVRSVTAFPRSKPSRARSARKRARAKRTVARKKSLSRKRRVPLPLILLEGDRPAPPPLSGPGEKFALGDHPASKASEVAELPEAYGTGRLFVTSRDPHWLYAHWDLTREQQRRYNARSVHGHLVLRTYIGAVAGKPVSERHVHPESRHWFTHVERAAAEYVAELGYYGRDHKWNRVATSVATATPPDTVSSDTGVSFATIPMEARFEEMQAKVKLAGVENLPLALAWEEICQLHQCEPLAATAEPAFAWTPERERALVEAIRFDLSPCAWMDSLAIAELIEGGPGPEISSPGAAEFGLAAWPAGGEEVISSPVEGFGPGAKGFWFNVNAELVIYGATERDTAVIIDGQRIALRPDGSFSYRFALPDGQYNLSVVAVAADETDGRAVELKFTRATEIAGDVGTHPLEPGLLPPGLRDVC